MRVLWRALFHRRDWERDLDEELRSHVELRADDLVRRGMTPDAAARQARLEFGAADGYRDDCREAHGLRWFEEFRQDVRYVLRTLRRSPGFTAAAVLSLALGIGANSAVFSFVNALLLKRLPIGHPEQVWFVQSGHQYSNLSYPDFIDFRNRSRTIDLAACRIVVMSLERDSTATRTWGYLASGNYFDLLGVRPAVGRFFHGAEDVKPGANPYAVLSYSFWQRRFAGEPGIAGRSIRINGMPYTVLGVAPRDFHGTELFYWPEIWVPMTMAAQIENFNWLDERGNQNIWVVGRLRNGAGREQAAADLTAIAADLAREHPRTNTTHQMVLSRPGMVGDVIGAPAQAFSGGLMVLAGLVLLAVCANLASLLAARAADRTRELAIRLSIGSGRGRIFRQLLTESLVLAAIGGAAGTALAMASCGVLSRWRPPLDFPSGLEIRPDWRVFAFSGAAALMAGLLSGLAPARQAWRADPNAMLKGQAARRGGAAGVALRDVLVGAQVALCCMLVACSFVAIRGLHRAFTTALGIDPAGVAVTAFDLDLARYDHDAGRRFQRRALEAVLQIPGVASAAFANTIPLNPDESSTSVFPEDASDRRPGKGISAAYFMVSPGYFRTVGTRLLFGREFDWHDTAAKVAVINERLARRLTGTPNAVGRRFRSGEGLVEIVGVVEDGKYQTLTEDPTNALFLPSTQVYSGTTLVLARSSLPEAALGAEMRDAIDPLDASLPLYGVGAVREMQQLAFLPSRAAVGALSVFGVLALTLAITGIYGLSAYSVSRRVREIGIRVAVGAGPREVLAAVLRRAVWLVGIGSLAGLVLAWLAGQVLAAVVYQASSHDPVVLGATAAALAAVGVGASFGPARRALRVDPARALRHE